MRKDSVREEAANDDDVLIVGRIGGSSNPWIEGRAAFTIVDLSVKSCNDTLDDKCPTPPPARKTVNGYPCLFPFKLNDELICDCTLKDADMPGVAWCAISRPKTEGGTFEYEACKSSSSSKSMY